MKHNRCAKIGCEKEARVRVATPAKFYADYWDGKQWRELSNSDDYFDSIEDNWQFYCPEHADEKYGLSAAETIEECDDAKSGYPCEFSAGYRCGNCDNCKRAEGASNK